MEDSICLDSDVLIDLLRDVPEAVKWVKENEDKYTLSTTMMNVFELYSGAYKSSDFKLKVEAVKELVAKLNILNLSLSNMQEAGKQYSRLESEGSKIEIRDVLIGSIALSEDVVLKTYNKKHFERINGLEVI